MDRIFKTQIGNLIIEEEKYEKKVSVPNIYFEKIKQKNKVNKFHEDLQQKN